MFDLLTVVVVLVLSGAGAFAAGLLGIGGAVVMVPAYVYLAGLPIHAAAGVSVVLALSSSLLSVRQHAKDRAVDLATSLPMAGVAVASGFLGGLASGYVSARFLTWLFAAIVIAAIGVLLLPQRSIDPAEYYLFGGSYRPSRVLAIGLGALIGSLSGLLGTGGGFLLLPLMLVVLNMPIRVAIGSSLVVVAASAASGVIGKLLAGQVDLVLAGVATLGAFCGSPIGARASRKLSPRVLRLLLVGLLGLIAVRVVGDLATTR
ncbi:MAG: sulfite exporter TauE/SafE family protein [Chloroflexi bacterium]|nr:sulfite exporter TauE/SafE family protein [Chloroflexota bacterium]